MKKQLTLGLLVSFRNSDWSAGPTYLKNIVFAMHELPPAKRWKIKLLFLPDFIDDAEAYASVLPFVAGVEAFTPAGGQADVLFPCLSPMRPIPGCAQIGWIPDLQHKHLPDFFKAAERAARDRQHLALLKQADLIVLSSQATENDVHACYGDSAPTFVLPFCSSPGQDWLAGNPEAVAATYGIQGSYLLCCNQFWAHKDHQTLFRALAKARKRGAAWQLVCTGNTTDYRNPDYFSHVQDILKALRLETHVKILGFIPRDDQIQLIRGADAVVQPSLFEGWSTVLEDARMLGKTIIYSDLPVHLEQSPDYGFAFKTGDAQDLARALADAELLFLPTHGTEREQAALAKNRDAKLRYGLNVVKMAETALALRTASVEEKRESGKDGKPPCGIFADPSAKISPRAILQKDDCRVEIGFMSIVEGALMFERDGGSIHIGDRTFFGGGSRALCATNIFIGNDVLVSFDVIIADHDSHSIYFDERKSDVTEWYHHRKDWQHVHTAPVRIHDKAWVGMRAVILKGVTIGEGAVVGAGSVVTRDVPPYAMVAGNPARVIKSVERATSPNADHASMSWEQAVAWLRDQPDQRQLVRDCYFDDPLLDAAKRYHAEQEWQCVRQYLPSAPGLALDVGAGRGIAAFALAEDGWTVTALEPDPSPLVGAGAVRKLAALTCLPIEVVEDFGEKLPFADATFDLVHARQVLHHAQDLEQLCRELCRVLKPGGTLVATREHVVDDEAGLAVFLEQHALHKMYGGENAFSLTTYRQALRQAGLKIKTVLNPLESPINYFPTPEAGVRQAAAQVLNRPDPAVLTAKDIQRAGNALTSPGRLYSFIAVRPVPAQGMQCPAKP